jgi:lipoprotein-anchoring transpeptidase ErfK/SrfK
MIGTSARTDFEAPPAAARPVFRLIGRGVALLALLCLTLAAVAAVVATTPGDVSLGMVSGSSDVKLDQDVRVSLSGWSAHLEDVALFETPIGADGRPGPERTLAVSASVLRESPWLDGAEFSLRPANGLLSPDASYRMVVRGSAITSALPSPGRTEIERETRFSTVRSPVPRGQAGGPATLKWSQPLQIQWDAPIADVRYEVSPPTPIKTAIDPNNRQLSTVVLENPDDGQTYKISVAEARGANGIALARGAEYTVVAPARPKLQENAEARTVELGTYLQLRFSTPMERVKLAFEPEIKHNPQVDKKDPTLVMVSLDGMEQGASYKMTVVEAVSREGAPLADGDTQTLAFETPERLKIDTWDPEPAQGRISVKSQPTLTFTQPIRDRKAAVAALAMEPAIPGRWEWTDEKTVKFTPATGAFPYDTDVTIKVKAGPAGARSTVGSFFENEAILEYRTESDKLIDVDVTRQVMTLYEKGKQVNTFKVGTGVPGADTPLGDFTVEYKMPTARFQGTNVTGARYDIPDVKWVLAFMGDYTIHGVYWRGNFGERGSNGCVGLSDEDAKTVFDWAPEGTRIKIHY